MSKGDVQCCAMLNSNMFIHVGLVSKLYSTMLAMEWSLGRVRPHVNLQLVFTQEQLATFHTTVLIFVV